EGTTGLTISKVNGDALNLGVQVAGTSGGIFQIYANGSWTFYPNDEFGDLFVPDTLDSSASYHITDGVNEVSKTLTVTVSGASGIAWTPAEITTALWLDAADTATITLNGSTVTKWADKSGHERSVEQSSSSSQPLYDDDLKSVNFDGVDDHLFNSLPFMYSAGSSYVYCVANLVTSVSNAYLLSEGRSSNNNPLYSAMLQQDGTASSGCGFLRNDAGTLRLAQAVGQFADFWATGQAYILSSEDTGSSFGMRKNGGAATSGAYIRSGAVTLDRFCFGGILRDTFAAPMHINTHELVVLTVAPSSDLRQMIEGYLAHKWDALLGVTTLVDALPSDHPYKISPPMSPPPSGDPYWNDVVLCINAQGDDGSTTITDEKGATITRYGDTQVDDSLGYPTILFDGQGDYFNLPTGANFNFGTSDFTIEFFVRVPSGETQLEILSKFVKWATNVDFRAYAVITSRKMRFTAGDGIPININSDNALPADIMTHVAICRESGVTRMFIAGSLQASTHSGAVNIPNDATTLTVGTAPGGGYMNGHIRAIRITAAARYSSSFTPPDVPFPIS
ncbi:MAG: LamG-like jellyroll fold domain-containing protein, partial [Syntrophus sp. (in: bacteria)]|nr:LamG-like jellyroll fold domain-containing protein [Syntrophus sp. (in: bacteria)]